MGPVRTLQLRPEALPAHGDLASTPFAVLLGWARAIGATGVLSVVGEKFVFFLRGTPVHVDSLLADETSEVYLKTRIPPAVDAKQLEAARAAARDSGRGVGEALLGLGWLDPSELFEHKKAHAREKLISCFAATAGAVRFEPRETFGSEFLPIPLDVPDALREGIARYYDRKRLDRELRVDDLCRAAPTDDAGSTAVSTDDARILQLAAGRPTLRSLSTEAGMRPDELRRHLYALYCLGLMAFELGAPIAEESAAERGMQHPFPIPKAPPGAGWAGRPPASSGGSDAAPTTKASPTPWPPTPHPASPPPGTGAPRGSSPPGPPATTPQPLAPKSRPAMPRPGTAPPQPPTATPRPPAPAAPTATPRPPVPAAPPATPRPPVPPSRSAIPRPPLPTPAPPAVPTPRPPVRTSPPRRDPTGTVPTRKDPTGPHATSALSEHAKHAIQEAIDAAEIARANEEHVEAIEILRAADKQYPEEPRLLAQLALTLVLFDERKYAKEANRLARLARTADPSLPLPFAVMGILLEQIGQPEQAAQMYRHALARDRDCALASQRLGLIEGVKATK